mgnify:CR=1 FL=1
MRKHRKLNRRRAINYAKALFFREHELLTGARRIEPIGFSEGCAYIYGPSPTYDEGYMCFGPVSLSNEKANAFHSKVIELAIQDPNSRFRLSLEMERQLKQKKPLATPYINFITQAVLSEIPAPKFHRRTRLEIDYPAALITAKKVSDVFKIHMTRNEASEPNSALDILAEAITELHLPKSMTSEEHWKPTYATLERDAYKKLDLNKVLDYYK